jgi:CPA2 family monovalent cation:H+ antiporter-2
MQGIDFIQDLAVVMLIAGLAGWLCHRLGLSVVVGYLVAGMIIGPHTPPFALVSDLGRIETLSQIGLVFLMFGIGLSLSLRKLQRLGLSLLVATFVGAIAVYHIVQAVGTALGWTPTESLFLAAMLMVSSSAVISKVLAVTGATHERTGQLALGITLTEDVVAIVMLTILGSVAQTAGSGPATLGGTLGLFGSFVVMAGLLAVLLVPRLLRRMSMTAGEELPPIVVAGLVFGLSLAAARSGFSLALGAFLIGAVVADTPQRIQLERAFEGMRSIFSAVFFVAIGMLIEPRSLVQHAPLILLVSALALVARSTAVALGAMVIGHRVSDAVRVGLNVTPLGEFSFIIAQLGITAGVIPGKYQTVAVGASLVTSLTAQALASRSAGLSQWLEARLPDWLCAAVERYHRLVAGIQAGGARSVLWRLSKPRLLQIGVEALLITGLLLFSEQIHALVFWLVPTSWPAANFAFWAGLTLVVLLPLVALWRNVSALAMLVADMATQRHPLAAKARPMVETGLKVGAGLLLFLWLSAVAPRTEAARWLPLLVFVVVPAALLLFRQRLIFWHSLLENELQERLQDRPAAADSAAPDLAAHAAWGLALLECTLPDLADVRGRTLADLGLRTHCGCTVAGVERQGVLVRYPAPTLALFPRDKVLLLGTPAQVEAGQTHLTRVSGAGVESSFNEVCMEAVMVPGGSKLAGRTLRDLAPSKKVGVQVAGLRRGETRTLNPSGEEKMLAGDEVLVLGSPDQVAAFRAWLAE